MLNSAVAAYYYLRLIVVMFFKDRTSDWHTPKMAAPLTAALVITVLGVFYFGIFGDSVISKFAQSPAAGIVRAEK